MVGSANRSRLTRLGALPILMAAVLAALAGPAAGQASLGLREFGARKPPDFTPAHAGERVRAAGTVCARAFHFPGYSLLAFDDGDYGAVLQTIGDDKQLDGFQPGDELQVEGTVSSMAGAVTIVPSRITVTGHRAPAGAIGLPLARLAGFRHLGRLVRTEGRIRQIGDNTAGAFLDLFAPSGSYRLFVPRPPGQTGPNFAGFSVGDKVQATGVAYQYCPRPPYDHYFELLVADPSGIARTERGWFIPPALVAIATAGVLLVGLFLWSREHRLRGQRERLRKTFHIGEEILGAPSAEAVVLRVSETLPGILGVTRVRLYVLNRAAKTLDAIPGENGDRTSISLSSPPGGTPAGAVACFHYRTLLVIPDIARSPFPIVIEEGQPAPKSLLFVPMLAQGEVIGVLELDQDDRARDFTTDEQALAQHLGNQIGVALRLLDQRSVQEQLFRTEKLAAVGRLISGVVNELQTPLASISELSSLALAKGETGPAGRELSALAAEAQKASGMVARLVSFAAEQVEARPVCISTLLHTLIEFREGDWKASGIRVRDLTAREPLMVLGSQGQLEQVFLNLLVHAEQSLASAPRKEITVRTSVLGKRLLVEIAFPAAPEFFEPKETDAVLGLTRGVIAGHGGEVRLVDKGNPDPRFEVELPLISRERAGPPSSGGGAARTDSSPAMTALVIEPEEAVERQILGMLAARGYRVVPVNNADNALELAHRMRFDIAFCSIHAPGLNWVELSERLQSRIEGFVLLSDGYDAELAADFEGYARFVLPKPVQEAELERILQSIEPPPRRKPGPLGRFAGAR